MNLYAGTAYKATADVTTIFAKKSGLSKAQADTLQNEVTHKLVALSEPLHLDPHELRDLNTIVLAHLLDIVHGNPVGGKVDHWTDQALADLKTRHVSLRRVSAVIADTNEWLKREHPGVHQALKDSRGLGSHPKIVRLMTDRFLAHESEQARQKRSARYVRPLRADASAGQIPPGGLMAGNAEVGATALAELGKSPLAGPPDAA